MNDLNKIKKYYGENLMHLCRNLFPTLLEKENLLFSLLDSNFEHSRFLYEDIIDNRLEEQFKNYIYSLVDVEKKEIKVIKNPTELLDEAGYILYECNNEHDIQAFKKYYQPTEELCTFNGGRLNTCYVFFAVKKNVHNIKRENFTNPTRQDEYGTSVISIQFSKGVVNTLSIKNRYNHSVNNPDATFSNDLENIIPGLTDSFEKKYNLKINQNNTADFDLTTHGYVKANDGKYYKYNYEINNIYYCPNNIIIDKFELKKYELEKYIIFDYFILDLVNKQIILKDKTLKDSFIDGLTDIKNISINKQNETKLITITFNNDSNSYIELDKYNRIIKYQNENLKIIGNNFLKYNSILKEIDIPNVTKIENDFLLFNTELQKINLPKLEIIGDYFLGNNQKIETINIPNVIIIRNNFLNCHQTLKEINIPNVVILGDDFLSYNTELKDINLPNTTTIGNNFLFDNKGLEKINIENVMIIGQGFLSYNTALREIYIPKATKVGTFFLGRNPNILKTYYVGGTKYIEVSPALRQH